MRRIREEHGTALVEAAVTIPLLLLIAVAIFDFGRAYQTWQVLTNAAREGARYAVTPYATVDDAAKLATDYMKNGALDGVGGAAVTVNRKVALTSPTGTPIGSATLVTITYPFKFMFLQPVARLVVGEADPGGALTMTVTATMRNETP